MGERTALTVDWVRNNQERYLRTGAPSIAADALQHVLMARSALMMGENEIALFMYKGANELWLKMEDQEPGEWKNEIAFTSFEMHQIVSVPPSHTEHDC
jgi:hypothetical protein